MVVDRQLLEKSQAILQSRSGEFIDHFYEEFFRSQPDLARVFRNTELNLQKERLWKGILEILDLVDRPLVLRKHLRDLGLRHICYEVRDRHYSVVGDKLLNAVKHVHQDEGDNQSESLWTSLVSMLVEEMIAGSRQVTEVNVS